MDMISLDFQCLLREILFWLHIFFIIAAVSVGLFVTPYLAFALVALHRIHVFLFGECVLSKVQKKAGGLPGNMNFLQLAVKRFFQKEISSPASQILDYCLAGSVLVISFVK